MYYSGERPVSPAEVYQGREPGVLNIPGVGFIRVEQWVEDVIYDTITIESGAVNAGAQYEWFTNLSGKNKDKTNMTEAGKLPENWEIIVLKYGIEFVPGVAMNDFLQIISKSFIQFKTGNNKIRRKAPTWAWPIGFGIWGDHATDEQSSETNTSILQVGIPSPSAVRPLLIPIRIPSRLNFSAMLQFDFATDVDISADVDIRFYLYGLISRPVQ